MLIDRHALKILAAASTDRFRSALKSLHVRDGQVEATDGTIFARVPLPPISPDEAPASWHPLAGDPMQGAILSRDDLIKVRKALPKSKSGPPILGTAAIGKADDAAQAVIGLPGAQTRLTVGLVEQTYPNADALWPNGKVTFQVAISGRLLAVLASLAEGDGGVPVVFTFRGGEGGAEHPIEFAVHDKDGRPITGLVMPMRLPEPPRGDASPPEPEPEDAETVPTEIPCDAGPSGT
ncbi:MAG: hypothetical protein L0214_12370 [candidate division NC10 bacterium]|nr:hypothetical protein [candidate division NC10 bacterium]